ncbi:MAG TPA: hypothetical protein VHO25_09410 [Polyangiaceae bacterium]|nr:hypothetical protein [Polyangiaceae bacterium]
MAQTVARVSPIGAKPRHLGPFRPTAQAMRCRRKFLGYFPEGFGDQDYLDLERSYKSAAAARFDERLGRAKLRELVAGGQYLEVARTAVAIEARTNLLFSFEKMALRDAVNTRAGARLFAEGLLDYVESDASCDAFERWCEAIARLPRRKTRVLTWPVVTVFGFLARPDAHLFLKPTVTRHAAAAYGFEFHYSSKIGWDTYASLLEFAKRVRRDIRDLRPRDMIDLQSFIWVLGSDEYP